MKSVLTKGLTMLTFLVAFHLCSFPCQAQKEVVIAIDPGHGGENLGAEYNGHIEKEDTLKVAYALKEELEKYDNVTVYLTRDKDVDMEIQDRAAFADSVDADILLSLHFNMSENHTLSGSEMWVSSKSYLYQKACQFTSVENKLLSDYGIQSRGTFIRMNSMNEDYYGIIRFATKYSIPAVIVEHCYYDNEVDEPFYNTQGAFNRFGKIDATALAMSYHLKSESLNVDYTNYKGSDIELPDKVVMEDYSAPERVHIELNDYFEETNELEVYVEAYDEESSIASLCYSFDGGKTFSDPIAFDGYTDTILSLKVYPQNNMLLKIKVNNSYDLGTLSNEINVTKELWSDYSKEELKDAPAADLESTQTMVFHSAQTNGALSSKEVQFADNDAHKVTVWTFFTGCLLALIAVCVLLFLHRETLFRKYKQK